MVNCINLIIEMSPRFILARENVPCVAEVVNRSLKADCTDYNRGNFSPCEKNAKVVAGKRSLAHAHYQCLEEISQ